MAVPEFYSGKLLYPAIGVLIALSALFGLAILPRFAPAHGGLIGKPAPTFSLPVTANARPDLKQVDLAALKGKAVLLDFWASWCGPCAAEAPLIDRLARRYEKKGLVVLGVNVSDTPEVTQAYAAKLGLSYPMVVDDERKVESAYGVEKLPSLIVIDKEGRVTAYYVGITDEAALDDVVTAAM